MNQEIRPQIIPLTSCIFPRLHPAPNTSSTANYLKRAHQVGKLTRASLFAPSCLTTLSNAPLSSLTSSYLRLSPTHISCNWLSKASHTILAILSSASLNCFTSSCTARSTSSAVHPSLNLNVSLRLPRQQSMRRELTSGYRS